MTEALVEFHATRADKMGVVRLLCSDCGEELKVGMNKVGNVRVECPSHGPLHVYKNEKALFDLMKERTEEASIMIGAKVQRTIEIKSPFGIGSTKDMN